MSAPLIVGQRRFACLSPTLLRLEFAPEGRFEDRRSLIAHEPQAPLPFAEVREDGDWLVARTDAIELRARQHDRPFDRNNLEIRWTDGRLCQYWRPGDIDFRNLGGTLRSLDRYGAAGLPLDGVHPATGASDDPLATNWPAWLQCEVDPLYKDLHPDPPERLGRGHWLRIGADEHDDTVVARTANWYAAARRFCPGLISRSGYCLLDDSAGAVIDDTLDFPVERDLPGAQDWYFFGYAKDFRQALADWRRLGGPAPLPPRQALGIMLSRWPAFTPDESRELLARFRAEGYPLSTLILDMEWHQEGWGHWDANPEILPEPLPDCFARLHQQGAAVVFNDHPLDVRDDDSHFQPYLDACDHQAEIRTITYNDKTLQAARVDICDPVQNRAFRDVCHREWLDRGLDYWWNDGTRGQLRTTSGQLVGNRSFFEEVEERGRRGMLLARYGGLGSHRYGAFFTGDTQVCWEVLQLQVEFNVRAAHLGLSYVSHDIGGFFTSGKVERIDPLLYLRWLQFGAFNPIFRLHSAPGSGSRLPWDYEPEADGACRHWLRVRHSLLPYLYTAGHQAACSGWPITRGLFLEWPEDDDAYRFDEYLFGPDLLVAPVFAADNQRDVYLPAGEWWPFLSRSTAPPRPLAGGQTLDLKVPPGEMAVFARAGSVIPRQDPDGPVHPEHVAELHLDVYPGTGESFLYEDDGKTPADRDGPRCRSRFRQTRQGTTLTLAAEVVAGQPLGTERHVRITLPASQAPRDLTLNGAPCQAKCREVQPGCWSLDLPPLPAAEPWTLTWALDG